MCVGEYVCLCVRVFVCVRGRQKIHGPILILNNNNNNDNNNNTNQSIIV